jgi:hypothetical protein
MDKLINDSVPNIRWRMGLNYCGNCLHANSREYYCSILYEVTTQKKLPDEWVESDGEKMICTMFAEQKR